MGGRQRDSRKVRKERNRRKAAERAIHTAVEKSPWRERALTLEDEAAHLQARQRMKVDVLAENEVLRAELMSALARIDELEGRGLRGRLRRRDER